MESHSVSGRIYSSDSSIPKKISLSLSLQILFNMQKIGIVSLLTALFLGAANCHAAPLKALIIDGQNNHAVWPKSTIMMRQYLEETGLFTVDIERSNYTWKGKAEAKYLPLANAGSSEDLPQPKTDPDFKPDFAKYDVVIKRHLGPLKHKKHLKHT